MSLTVALNTAIQGLSVNQKALAVISQNIANANTAGYTRKTMDLASVELNNGTGSGVQIAAITRKIDQYLDRAIRSSTSDSSQAAVMSDYMGRLQVYLGQPGQGNTLDVYLQNFFNAMQNLAETPERATYTTQAVQTANQAAQDISQLANAMQDLRYQADQDMGAAISDFNQTIKKLSVVNQAIAYAHGFGNNTADLLDKRDLLLKDAASFMDVQVLYQPDGQAYLYTKSGINLLSEETFQLSYNATHSSTDFSNASQLGAINVVKLNQDGSTGAVANVLVSGGDVDKIDSSAVRGGKLRALIDLRDSTLPGMLDQIDQLAATLRDQFNAVHNLGSSFPGATSYTGTRGVLPEDYSTFSGKIQIALVKTDGTPVDSLYSDEQGKTASRPLTLDLSKLDSGYGQGNPTTQGIIDEINAKYGTPQNKASLGNFNQIQLASKSVNIPGIPPSFNFDFDIENISGGQGQFFVTDVDVLDDVGANITNVSTTQPQLALDPASTFTTSVGSNVVTVKTAASPSPALKNGDWVYIPDPGTGVNGLSSSQVSGYFQISNLTSTGFDINVQGTATAAGAVGVSGFSIMPAYDKIDAGDFRRTGDNGSLTANLSGNANSQYYDFVVHVGNVGPDGTVSTGTITYRVLRANNLLNQRSSASAVTGAAKVTPPSTNQAQLRAYMVDENGVEIPQVNGKTDDIRGYLKIESLQSGAYVAFTDLGSEEKGITGRKDATGRGFFHYFELNDFFHSNKPSNTGDTMKGSAQALKVEQRLLDQPSLMTTGQLSRSNQPTDPSATPIYSYQRNQGDNSLAQRLASLGTMTITFTPAGGLPPSTTTLGGYAGQAVGFMADTATNAKNDAANQKVLVDGLASRADSISGVNLDQELADTIIYQNAYTASARIITVTNELFQSLLGAFQ